jgi:hypothetical protein
VISTATVAVLLLLAPHPSILHVLLNYHYLTLRAPLYFVAHLLIIYSLSFLAFSSLIACVARDPGPVPDPKSEDVGGVSGGTGGGDEISIEDALLSTAPPSDDYSQPGRWCRICWRPKPERAHHCSQCGRCVLKMGACPLAVFLSIDLWIYRTHTTFLFAPRNVAIRPPLSLDGRKMHRALFLTITESNGHPVPLRGVITHCARATETLFCRASGRIPLSFISSHPSPSWQHTSLWCAFEGSFLRLASHMRSYVTLRGLASRRESAE